MVDKGYVLKIVIHIHVLKGEKLELNTGVNEDKNMLMTMNGMKQLVIKLVVT